MPGGVRTEIHLLEGEFEIEVDGTSSQLSAGQTVHIPRGVTHAGANIGKSPGRRVFLFSPGGLERFFLEAGAPTPEREIDSMAALTLATRHGWEFTGRG